MHEKIGRAWINIKEIIAGAVDTWTIVFEAGTYGIDDGGEIIIARRDVSDSDIPQFENAVMPGYVKVYGSYEAKLRTQYIPDKYKRPWKSCISIKVYDGSLKKGDTIHIQFGASPAEGLGYMIQTFREREHQFKVLVDCAGSGDFFELEEQPQINIIGGFADHLEVILPSMVEPGDEFDVFVRALDSWGNIAERYNGEVIISLNNRDEVVRIEEGIGKLTNFVINTKGVYYAAVVDVNKGLTGQSNPMKCMAICSSEKLFWGDMHGQTHETVGTGTLDEYFSFARDCALLDFTAWQGNDFQVTDDCWNMVCQKIKDYHVPGRFITFLGYEWSGNVPAGGDYNVYYLEDDQPIYRSYRWQIGMHDTDGTDRNPISALWDQFHDRKDVMAIPHVGGRHGNLDYADPEFVNLLEIHSHHGTFEWFFEDALRKGLKLGIIAASDDHTCRPGLSFPTRKTSRGLVSFDVKGGYTGIYTDELSRKSLWEAFKKRHCYGTTGERIILHVKSDHYLMGDEYTTSAIPLVQAEVIGTDIIDEIEIFRGLDIIHTYSGTLPVNRKVVKIQWSGVRSKGRSKKSNWDGGLSVHHGRIVNYTTMAFQNSENEIVQTSNQILKWKSNTSGNVVGLEMELDYKDDCRIDFSTTAVSFSLHISDLMNGDKIIQADGVNQKVKIGMGTSGNQRTANLVITDQNVQPGSNPYWVRVLQKDGHMAWSSPVYVTYSHDLHTRSSGQLF